MPRRQCDKWGGELRVKLNSGEVQVEDAKSWAEERLTYEEA